MWMRGKGALVVLIHGTPCDYRHWGLQLGVLGKAHRVIAVSLRRCYPARWDGIGTGDMAAEHIADMERQSRSTCSEILAAAQVAFGAARQWPHQLRSLILADPGGSLEASLAGGDAPAALNPLARLRRARHPGRHRWRARQLLRCHQRPCGWDKVPEIGKVMMGDNAHTLLGQSERAPSALPARRDARDQGADAVDQRRAQLGLLPRADAMLQHLADARRVDQEGGTHG